MPNPADLGSMEFNKTPGKCLIIGAKWGQSTFIGITRTFPISCLEVFLLLIILLQLITACIHWFFRHFPHTFQEVWLFPFHKAIEQCHQRTSPLDWFEQWWCHSFPPPQRRHNYSCHCNWCRWFYWERWTLIISPSILFAWSPVSGFLFSTEAAGWLKQIRVVLWSSGAAQR